MILLIRIRIRALNTVIPSIFLNFYTYSLNTYCTYKYCVFGGKKNIAFYSLMIVFRTPKERRKGKFVAQSCLTLCDPMDCSPPHPLCPWNSPGKSTGVGCHSLLQGIFPTQGSNPALLHCRQISLPTELLGKSLRTPKEIIKQKWPQNFNVAPQNA